MAVHEDSKACQVTCPFCKASIVTKVKRKTTAKTHVMKALLCSCLCGLLCTIARIHTHARTEWTHYCPDCGAHLGK